MITRQICFDGAVDVELLQAFLQHRAAGEKPEW
jgi:hypothetical protein